MPPQPACGNTGPRVTVIGSNVRLFCRHRRCHRAPATSFEENFVDFTPESGTITMFSTTWCCYCNRLKKQLDAQGIGYTEINIEEVEGTADLVEKLNGGNRTVPTVLFPDGTAATNPSAAEVKSRLAA
jgi:mycoredoxin